MSIDQDTDLPHVKTVVLPYIRDTAAWASLLRTVMNAEGADAVALCITYTDCDVTISVGDEEEAG